MPARARAPGFPAGARDNPGVDVPEPLLTARPADRRLRALLGLPTLGLSLSVTTVASFMPLFLQQLSGPLPAGAFIAAEGLVAILVPGPVGAWSIGPAPGCRSCWSPRRSAPSRSW